MNLLGTAFSLAALGVSAFLAVYVLGMNPRGSSNRAFFALMMTFVWWDACEAIERAIPTGAPTSAVYPWVQGVWLGISAVPAALMQLALTYPETRPWFRPRWAKPLVYLPFFGWAYLILSTNFLISGVTEGLFGPSAQVGTHYLVLVVLYACWFYVSVGLFVVEWWRLRGSSLRRMQGVVVAGLLLGSIPAGITEMFWPFLGNTTTRLGLGTLYTLAWSASLAFAIARYRYLVIEPVMEPRAAARAKHPLEKGLNYLVLEPGRSAGMGAFREIVSTTPGLCVTGLAPSRVARRFGLERTPILWVTTASSGDRTARPQGLDFEIVHATLKFLRENPGTAILLDDLDYLALVDGFDAVARFLKRVANQASASGGTVIATAGRGTFAPDQIAVLGGCVDHVVEVPEASNGVTSSLQDHAFLFVPPQDVSATLPFVGVTKGLVVTTEHPAKARQRFGESFEILWITEHPEPGLPSARPTALDTEAKRVLLAHLAKHPGTTVVLVGLDQIALFTDFRSLAIFVKDALDLTSLHGSRVVATVSPNAFPPREVAILARRFDAPSGPVVFRTSPAGALSTAVPGSRTLNRGPVS